MQISVKERQNVGEVKEKACSLLLAKRVEQKSASKRAQGILNRLHVAMPRPRDTKERPATIPDGFVKKSSCTEETDSAMEQPTSAKSLQEENGGAGVFFIPKHLH